MSPRFQVKNSNYDLINTLLSLLLYFTTFTQILHATAIFYNNSQIRTATFRSTFAAIPSRPKAKIKCSICSNQCENWLPTCKVGSFHIHFCILSLRF